jgi:hypothetical protein
VKGFVTEAKQNGVCGVAFNRASRLAHPNPSSHTMRPLCATATATPVALPAATASRIPWRAVWNPKAPRVLLPLLALVALDAPSEIRGNAAKKERRVVRMPVHPYQRALERILSARKGELRRLSPELRRDSVCVTTVPPPPEAGFQAGGRTK